MMDRLLLWVILKVLGLKPVGKCGCPHCVIEEAKLAS